MNRFISALSNISIDTTFEAENKYIVTTGNTTFTFEEIEDGFRISTIIDNELTTYEITTDYEPISDTALRDISQKPKPTKVLLNGTELNTTLDNIVSSQPVQYPYELPQTRGDYYWWDGVYFKENYETRYPHPDKTHYMFSNVQDWYTIGEDLLHYQFRDSMSTTLMNGGPGLIGAVIGAAIGSIFGPVGSVLGAIVVGIVGLGWGLYSHDTYIDEQGCLWFFTDHHLPVTWGNMWAYISLMIDIGVDIVTDSLLGIYEANGYFRIGSKTEIDGINKGDPHEPPQHASVQYVSSTNYAPGAVAYANRMIGSPPNGQEAYIYGTSATGSGGQIVCTMDQTLSGNIWIYGYSASGYRNRLYTYVSNDLVNWQYVNVRWVENNGGQIDWIKCGFYDDYAFKYVAIAAITESGYVSFLGIDTLIVTPY